MTIQFTLTSGNPELLKLVHEFAEGLECELDVPAMPYTSVRARLPEEASASLLLHLLSYVALSAVKLGLDTSEPQCRVQFREPKAAATVMLALTASAIEMSKDFDTGAKAPH